MAQDNIVLPQKTVEHAFKYPTFDWAETIEGKPGYPNPGSFLMHNLWPKKKKKKAKKGRMKSPRKRTKSPKK